MVGQWCVVSVDVPNVPPKVLEDLHTAAVLENVRVTYSARAHRLGIATDTHKGFGVADRWLQKVLDAAGCADKDVHSKTMSRPTHFYQNVEGGPGAYFLGLQASLSNRGRQSLENIQDATQRQVDLGRVVEVEAEVEVHSSYPPGLWPEDGWPHQGVKASDCIGALNGHTAQLSELAIVHRASIGSGGIAWVALQCGACAIVGGAGSGSPDRFDMIANCTLFQWEKTQKQCFDVESMLKDLRQELRACRPEQFLGRFSFNNALSTQDCAVFHVEQDCTLHHTLLGLVAAAQRGHHIKGYRKPRFAMYVTRGQESMSWSTQPCRFPLPGQKAIAEAEAEAKPSRSESGFEPMCESVRTPALESMSWRTPPWRIAIRPEAQPRQLVCGRDRLALNELD